MIVENGGRRMAGKAIELCGMSRGEHACGSGANRPFDFFVPNGVHRLREVCRVNRVK